MKLRGMLTFSKEHDTIFQCFSEWVTKRLLLHCGLLCKLQRHEWLLWIFHRPLWKSTYSPDNGTILLISVFCGDTKLKNTVLSHCKRVESSQKDPVYSYF